MRSSITKQDVEALLDNQLPPTRAAAVTVRIQNDPDYKAYYETLVAQKKLLRQWWQLKVAKDPIPLKVLR